MQRTCAKCGTASNEDTAFCTTCGAPYPPSPEDVGQKERAPMDNEKDEVRGTAKLAGNRVIDQWFMLIAGAQGHGRELTGRVQQILEAAKVPSLTLRHKEVHLGLLNRMFKGTRKFLVVDNKYLRGYRVFIGTRDYGEQLAVSWYLTLERPFLRRVVGGNIFLIVLLSPFLFIGWAYHRITRTGYITPELMNLFDREELSSYASTVHQAAKEATGDLMKEMGLNSAKVSTHTRGFLNLS